jgi:hypothetical protein
MPKAFYSDREASAPCGERIDERWPADLCKLEQIKNN